MKFFMMMGAEGYCQISAVDEQEETLLNRAGPYPLGSRLPEMRLLREHADDKIGEYFCFSSAHYFSERAIRHLGPILTSVGELREVTIPELNQSRYYRFWLTKVCDCLDVKRTESSKPSNWLRSKLRGKIGVIKRPVFLSDRWDGSLLFKAPQDPSENYFVAQSFVDICISSEIRGVSFSSTIFGGEEVVVR